MESNESKLAIKDIEIKSSTSFHSLLKKEDVNHKKYLPGEHYWNILNAGTNTRKFIALSTIKHHRLHLMVPSGQVIVKFFVTTL